MDANTPPTEERGSKEGLRFKDLFRPAKSDEAPSYPVARADWHPSDIWVTTPHLNINHDEYDLVPLPLGESGETETVPHEVKSELPTKGQPNVSAEHPDPIVALVTRLVNEALQPARKAFLKERRRLNDEIGELVDEIATRDAQIDLLNQKLAVVFTELNRVRAMVYSQRKIEA